MAPSRWTIHSPRPAQRRELARQLSVSEIIAQILINRGAGSVEDARRFLSPELKDLHDPCGLTDMEKAVDRVREAVRGNQKILLYGDYDVDGCSATAIMARFFALLPYPVETYLPDRFHEGYGLSSVAVRGILKRKPNLLVALDNGIAAHEEIAAIRRAGIDVIVVDHHHIDGALPEAFAVVNPRRQDDGYPQKDLCAAALAFKFAWGLSRNFSGAKKVTEQFRKFLCQAIGLACLGTVADVVPLKGENRVIACHGLDALRRRPSEGLRALIDVSRYTKRPLTSTDIAFGLAPRLNAAGRLKTPEEALALLLCEDPGQSRALAESLEKLNRERQRIEAEMLEAARRQVQEQAGRLGAVPAAIVLGEQGWHAGVIGIVAARLCEEFCRPTVLVAFDKGVGRGSARSLEGFHLAEMLKECRSELIQCGGHSAAAGLQVAGDMFPRFRDRFTEAAGRRGADRIAGAELVIEAEAALASLDEKTVRELESLAPFGEGNPPPTLAALNLRISSPIKPMGKNGEHVSFYVKDGDGRAARRVVAFRFSGRADELRALAGNGPVDLAFQPTVSTYFQPPQVELKLVDFRPSAGV